MAEDGSTPDAGEDGELPKAATDEARDPTAAATAAVTAALRERALPYVRQSPPPEPTTAANLPAAASGAKASTSVADVEANASDADAGLAPLGGGGSAAFDAALLGGDNHVLAATEAHTKAPPPDLRLDHMPTRAEEGASQRHSPRRSFACRSPACRSPARSTRVAFKLQVSSFGSQRLRHSGAWRSLASCARVPDAPVMAAAATTTRQLRAPSPRLATRSLGPRIWLRWAFWVMGH